MAVRNFYLTADIDGRETALSGGPRAKDGGMSIKLYQRDDGIIRTALRIECIEEDGELVTLVYDDDGNKIASFYTKR